MESVRCPVCGAEMGSEEDGGGYQYLSCLQCGVRSEIHLTYGECARDVALGHVVPMFGGGGGNEFSFVSVAAGVSTASIM